MSRHRPSSARHYPRTARLNELLREIVAEELERIDDERLTMVTVTGVDCDADLGRATVYFDSLSGAEGDDETLAALAEVRYLLQRAVARQARIKRTPELGFEPDPAVRTAERLEAVLRTLPEVASTTPAAGERLIEEQKDYYRARAPEYEQWWDRSGRYDLGDDEHRRWVDEVEQLEAAVDSAQLTGSVLELACGTGVWTRPLSQRADRLHAVDASAEVIELNRARLPEGHCPVTFEQADLFDWEPSECYDSVFFSFWLTHVPAGRFGAFWELVDRALVPGGQFFLLDNAGPYNITDGLDDPLGPGVTRRQLADGREFDIVKQYYEAAELADRLADLGWDAHFTTTDSYFLYGGGRRAGHGSN